MHEKEDFKLYYKEHALPQEEGVLLDGIIEEAVAKGMGKIIPFAFFIEDNTDKIVGGVKGTTYYGCLYIDLLWVARDYRHKKWGTKLISESEKLGQERGCSFAILTTMEWEALNFYQKLGYSIEYVREGYEKNSKMYALRKSLV